MVLQVDPVFPIIMLATVVTRGAVFESSAVIPIIPGEFFIPEKYPKQPVFFFPLLK